MKIMGKKKYVSLRVKLLAYVCLLFILVFTAITVLMVQQTKMRSEERARLFASELKENVKLRTERQMDQIENIVSGILYTLPGRMDKPGDMIAVSETALRLDTFLQGVSVVVYADGQPNHGAYVVSTMRTADGTLSHKVLAANLAKTFMNRSCYKEALAQPEGCWSEPFMEEGLDHVPMVCYSHQLQDGNGNSLAMVMAHLPLSKLRFSLGMQKGYEGNFSIILSDQGYFIAHPDTTLTSRPTTYQEFAERKGGDTGILAQGNAMIAGQSGTDLRKIEDKEFFVSFSPLEGSSWSVASLIPYSSVVHNVWKFFLLMSLVTFAFVFLFGILAYIYLRKKLTPLQGVTDAFYEMGQGNFDVESPRYDRNDEIGRLSTAFIHLKTELKQHVADLMHETREKQNIESELNLARRIQTRHLPAPFNPKKYNSPLELETLFKSSSEMGGDFYDYVVHKGILYFVMCDISTKGLASSLMLTVLHSLFHIALRHSNKPSEIMSSLNNGVVISSDEEMFTTLMVGKLNLSSGEMELCSAGHTPPVLLQANGQADLFKMESNLPLGVIDNYEFQDASLQLRPGMGVLFYTSGLEESNNAEGMDFGRQRILSLLGGSQTMSAREILDMLEQEVRQFVGEKQQTSDLTMMCMRWDAENAPHAIAARQSEIRSGVVADVPAEYLRLTTGDDTIQRASAFVDAYCQRSPALAPLNFSLSLALEEALSSLIQHAYQGQEGKPVFLTMEVSNSRLEITLSDEGQSFNPLHAEPGEAPEKTEELGILLLRRLMDSVSYQRQGDKDVLTMVKNL